MNLRSAPGNRRVLVFRMLTSVVLATTLASGPAAAGPPAEVAIDIVARKPAGGVRTLRIARGDSLVLRVRADEKTTVHVHGYDAQVVVEAGATATLPIVARYEGRFAVAAHPQAAARDRHGGEATLLYLEVYPP